MSHIISRKTEESLSQNAEAAILSVPGVSSLSSVPISYTLRYRELSRGIAITRNDEEQALDIFINVLFGARIPQVAFAVQEAVKKCLDHNNIKLDFKINIHVQGIDVNEKN